MQTENTTQTTETVARYEELKQKVAAMEADFVRFFIHGNKAAGTRVRNAMQDLKTFAQAVRTEVQAIKNEGKPAGEGGEAGEEASTDH
jgi:hypothetical protein